ARAVGPGERSHPACAAVDHPRRHAGGLDPARLRYPGRRAIARRRRDDLMSAATQTLDTVQSVTQSGYKWGFETDIEMDLAPKGLSEDTIRLISARKEEPAWLLDWRLKAFAAWQQMTEPHWARVE